MRLSIVLMLLALCTLQPCWSFDDWGRNGHRATAAIAENYLSKKAQRRIEALLDGQSLVVVSTWADEIKSDSRYRRYSPWHYVNFPLGQTYKDHPRSEKGDIIQAIDSCLSVLRNPRSGKQQQAFHLKLLVHLVGDLHQPLHIGLASDKGGNDFQVRWFNQGTNLHTVWDTKMLESYNMSYSELAKNAQRLSKRQIEVISAGTHRDWMRESRELFEDVYKNTQKGEKLGYRYMYRYLETARFQLQKGGIRLARLLNELFG